MYNLTKNVFYQQSGSLCGKARCNFLDDIALAFPEARIALGFLQRGVLLLLQLLDAKGFAGLPFLPLFKDDGQKIQTVFCIRWFKAFSTLGRR